MGAMDYSCCPFSDLTVPSSALERCANGHFEEVEDDEVDKQLARDLEFAQELALAPSSPPSAMKDQAIGEFPFWRCDAEISMEEKVSCLIALQTRTTFHKIEGGLMALLRGCLELERGMQPPLCPVILIIFRAFNPRTRGGVAGGVTFKCVAPTCLCKGKKLGRFCFVVRVLFLISHKVA